MKQNHAIAVTSGHTLYGVAGQIVSEHLAQESEAKASVIIIIIIIIIIVVVVVIVIIIIVIIIITVVLYSTPSRFPTQERSQPSLGQTEWS